MIRLRESERGEKLISNAVENRMEGGDEIGDCSGANDFAEDDLVEGGALFPSANTRSRAFSSFHVGRR